MPERVPPAPRGTWQRTTLPGGLRSVPVTITGLASGGRDSAWAVGSRGSGTRERPVALAWNRTRWVEHPVPAGVRRVTTVVAGVPGEAWALAYDSPTNQSSFEEGAHLLHWIGGAWQTISAPGNLRLLAGDATGRVFVAGADHGKEFVAQRSGPGWKKLPAQPKGDNLRFDLLTVVPGSRLWAGSGPIGFDGTVFASWDGRAWRGEGMVGGPHVIARLLNVQDDSHVWFTANQSWFGGPYGAGRPVPDNFIFIRPADSSTITQPVPGDEKIPLNVLTVAGHWSQLQWAAGERVLVRYQGKRWVKDASPASTVQVLAAVPGDRGAWLAGTTAQGALVLLHHN